MYCQRFALTVIGSYVALVMAASDSAAADATPRVLQVALAETAAPNKKDKVTAEAHLSVDKLPPGSECKILIRLSIQEGWHINANPAAPEGFIATEVAFKGKHGTQLGQLQYPKGKPIRMQDFDEPVSVYDGKVNIFGVLKVPESAAGQAEEMEIVVKYQACDDQKCLIPTSVKLSGKLPVAKTGETVRSINEKLFKPQDK
ncbi:hypothetical protein GC163_14780 [bacterium]|nr:hypothetical protein [bacterium]